ncbi:MAG: complex I NDUFA9 subunit family protein [Xanthomonadaceae bacterium]|nr:complex I NDUFA9 subunit family protein [Xanthomonadaceae bacterium]MDE2246231.1 complex I NDUFA9 subunit family protein [Xanthomonadaceae bacterium]
MTDRSARPQRLLILGGTGFVGSHLVPRLAADGHALTLLSRNRERHRELAVLPQVRIRNADPHDRAALIAHLRDADAVINLVGILNETGGARFRRAHVELTATLVAACREAGVGRLHQMSSLRAGEGRSQYLTTRGEAEAVVRASGLAWTIYRPSVIFGPGDGLVSRFAALLRLAPVLPLARPQARLAPVAVQDVVAAIVRGVGDPATAGRSFELYGPETLTLIAIVRAIRDAMGLHRLILPLPDTLGRVQARLGEFIPGKPISRDNFLSLLLDSVGREDGLAALGIRAHPFRPALPALLHDRGRQARYDAARAGAGR